jgi:hypothetical protein
MDLSKLATLKAKLVEANDFSQLAAYFFDEFGEDPSFAMTGEPMTDMLLSGFFGQVAVKMVGGRTMALRPRFVRIAEHRFVHGAFTLDQWTGMMFYFEDIERGFMALGGESGPTHFGRFSLIKTPAGRSVQLN